MPTPFEILLSGWATSRSHLTIAPGDSGVTIVDGVGGVTEFSTSGVPERHDIFGVSVRVTTQLEQTVLNQRIETEVGIPFALIWSLKTDQGHLVATLSLDNSLGDRLTLERRIYTSDAFH